MTAEHPIIPCEDCGKMFPRRSTLTRRCSECAKQYIREEGERYYLIKCIRSNFAVIAQVAPEEAKAIEEDMIQEDGPAFKEMLLDGILERVKPVSYPEAERDG